MTRLFALIAMISLLAGCGPAPLDDRQEDDDLPEIPAVPPPDAKDANFKPFPTDDKVVTLPSGLKYKDIEVGPEQGKVAKDGVNVRVHYCGWLESGKRFDFSWRRGTEPTTFKLAEGSVVKGFVEGISGMREGGHRLIWMPSDMAYGEAGRPGTIPPNSPLIFDVRLWEVTE